MGSYERLASCIVKVAFHEEVEEMGGVTADRAKLGVTALEDFVAQRGTHVCPAIKECTGELQDVVGNVSTCQPKKSSRNKWCHYQQLSQVFHLVNEGPERGEDLFEGSLRLRDLQKAQMDLENLLHQGVVTKI